jgi:hypothetical protein
MAIQGGVAVVAPLVEPIPVLHFTISDALFALPDESIAKITALPNDFNGPSSETIPDVSPTLISGLPLSME